MLCAIDLHAVPTAREAPIWPFSTAIKYLRHFALFGVHCPGAKQKMAHQAVSAKSWAVESQKPVQEYRKKPNFSR